MTTTLKLRSGKTVTKYKLILYKIEAHKNVAINHVEFRIQTEKSNIRIPNRFIIKSPVGD